MKMLLGLLLLAGLPVLGEAQIRVGVWTDKPIYQYGDTVSITITAHNPGADTLVLEFLTTCQENYIIDNYNFKDYVICGLAATDQTIPPHGSYAWPPFEHPKPRYGSALLSPGPHVVIGEVGGHGFSDTLLIFVMPVTGLREDQVGQALFLLGQNYPNPFNAETVIPYSISSAGNVVLSLFNSVGQRVRTLFEGHLAAGFYTYQARLRDLPSGTYWCSLDFEGKRQTRRLVLTK